MAIARMAVSLPCHSATEGQDTLWLGLVAFGRVAESLALHKKADMLSVSGAMRATHWLGQDGVQQTGYQIVADAVVSARTVQPGGTVNTTKNDNSQPPKPGQEHPGQAAVSDAARSWEIYQVGADGDAFDQRRTFDET